MAAKAPRVPTYSLREDFGGKGDNASNDHAAFQRAVAQIKDDGGGSLYIGRGHWLFWPTALPVSFPSDYAANLDWHAMAIDCDDIAIIVDPGALLECRVYGGGVASSNFNLAGGAVWRGAGMFVSGGEDAGSKRTNVTFQDLTLYGTAGNTGNNTWPANTSTGDGWDVTHKGVWLENDKYFDGVHFQGRCEVYGFAGELVYAGGSHVENVTVDRLRLHDTNSSCWSVDGSVRVRDLEAYDTANHGVEDFQGSNGPSTYDRVRTYDCALTGLNIVATDARAEPIGPTRIKSFLARSCTRNALLLNGVRHVEIQDMQAIDCSPSTPNRVIQIDTSSQGSPYKIHDVYLGRVRIIADQANVYDGLALVDSGGAGMEDVVIDDLQCILTDRAAAAGKTFHLPITASAALLASVKINRLVGKGTTFQFTQQKVATDTLLTGTSATTIAQYRPNKARNFQINVYYRVVTAATDVTITVEHYDGQLDGSSNPVKTTTSLVSAPGATVGGHPVSPIVIYARGTSETEYIKVKVTAGTANQVYASASIVDIPE